MDSIPWYKSPVYIALVVNIVNGFIQVFKWTDIIPPETVAAHVGNVFALIALVYAIIGERKRRKSEVQPLTLRARKPPHPYDYEGGFIRAGMLGLLLAVSSVGVVVTGCEGTRAAYEAVEDPADYAYVIGEQYASTLERAVALKDAPGTPPEVIESLRTAETAATPAVTAMLDLRADYLAIRSSDTQEALQAAVNRAVLRIADLLRVIQKAGG